MEAESWISSRAGGVATHEQQHDSVTGLFISTSIGPQVTHLVFVLSAILVVLAGITTTFTTWATVIDAQRPTALARALGATPRQVGAGLTAAQLLPVAEILRSE